MPTNRKRRYRGTTNQITPRIIQAWTRLRELEAMDLPPDDPGRAAHGEMDMLQFEIMKNFDLAPWDFGSQREAEIYKALNQAAGYPYEAELKALAEKRYKQGVQEEIDYIKNGYHPWGWTLEGALDEFEETHGFRPDIDPAEIAEQRGVQGWPT